MTIRGKAYIAGIYEHPRRRHPRPYAGPDPRRGRARRAGRRRAHAGRRRRRLLPTRRPRASARISMAEYLGLQGQLRRHHRDRRLVVPRPRRPRRRRDRRRQVLDRAVHARRQAAQPAARGSAAGRRRAVARGRLRGRSGASTGAVRQLRPRRPPAHVRVRHDERAAGRDQGRGVAARAAQPERLPAGRRSPSRRCSTRRWSATRCTASTAASSPTAAARSSSSAPRSPASSSRPRVKILGHGEAPKHTDNGRIDLTYTRRGVVRAAGLRGSRRHARRHRLRVDLRLVHDHRARVRSRTSASARRARAASSSLDGALRRAPRQAAVQHRRRRPVQQPPGQPRRHDQGASRPSASCAARPTRRCRCPTARSPSPTAPAARSAPAWAAPPSSSDRRTLMPSTSAMSCPPTPRRVTTETQEFWDATAEGVLLLPRCDDCGTVIWYPRLFCPDCRASSIVVVRGQRARAPSTASRSPTGAQGPWREVGAVRRRLRRARRRPAGADQHRRVRRRRRRGRAWPSRSSGTTPARAAALYRFRPVSS